MFDPTKPVQTRRGEKAEIIASAVDGDRAKLWGRYETCVKGYWLTREWYADGQFDRLNRDDPDQVACDIVNVEEPCA